MATLILIAGPEPRRTQLLRDVRQSLFQLQFKHECRPRVQEVPTFEGLGSYFANGDEPPVIVASSCTPGALGDIVPQSHWPLCVIVRGGAAELPPLATPYLTHIALVDSIRAHDIQKLLLLQRTRAWLTVRELATETEMRQYLALRYQVWTEMGYISEDCSTEISQLEVDYSDRYATALGAFVANSGTEQLVGGIRLIHEQREHNSCWAIIQQILARENDPGLAKLVERRAQHHFPFDLLASFPRFQETYRFWVLSGKLKAELSRMIVDRHWRQRGVGEVLVDSAIAYARGNGLGILFLACKEEHAPFYSRSGFQLIPGLTCKTFAVVNVPAVGMVLYP